MLHRLAVTLRSASLARLALIAAVFASGAAWAWPIDVAVSVKAGDVHFEHPAAIAWAESADPSIATVEVLRSGEVLVTGKKPGSTLALLDAEGKMGVWRITVTDPDALTPPPPAPTAALEAAKKACPTLRLGEKGSEDALSATIPDERCRQALLTLFHADAFLSRELSLTFTLEPLQEQLRAISKAIKPIAPEVKASYVGAGLVLEGTVTAAQHRKILWAAFENSVGRVPLEDQLTVETPPTDGGTPNASAGAPSALGTGP